MRCDKFDIITSSKSLVSLRHLISPYEDGTPLGVAFDNGSNCVVIIDNDLFCPFTPRKSKNYLELWIEACEISGTPLQLRNTVHATPSSMLQVTFVKFLVWWLTSFVTNPVPLTYLYFSDPHVYSQNNLRKFNPQTGTYLPKIDTIDSKLSCRILT